MAISGLGTWFGLITASFTMMIALFTLVTALISRKSKKTVDQTYAQTIEIHQIVNQQRTNMMQYMEVMRAALAANGIEIPVDQSNIPVSAPETKEN